MTRKIAYGTLFALLVLAVAVAAPALRAEDSDSMTAAQVVALNLEARGGADKIAAMESARITGKRTMGPGMEAPFTMEWKKPNKVRLEFTFQGQTGIQAFDGETAWMLMPFLGQTGPEKMPEDAAQQIMDQADFQGPLVSYEEKGHQVEYLGIEEIEGTPAHKLHLTKKSGDEITLYLDADANLEIKALQKTEMNGQEMDVDVSFGDYKEVGGMMFAHDMAFSVPGMPEPQHVTIDDIELNVDIPDSRFTMPETGAGEAPAEGE